MKRQLKLIVAYDGTAYEGWQTQPHGKSIVDKLERSFFAVFNRPIKIIGSSRTDAGVHALGQIASCYTDLSTSESQIE